MAAPARGVVHRLLERAHSPDTASQIFSDKIQHREQFLRPTSPGREASPGGGEKSTTKPSAAAAASLAAAAAAAAAADLAAASASGHNGRDARRRSRRLKQEQRRSTKHGTRTQLKPKPLSSRERRALEKITAADTSTSRSTTVASYKTFVPLHRLWLGYIREVLGPQELAVGGAAAAAKLTAADFHGALVEVTRSACVGRVGTRGIVVRDTRFVFEIVTPANEVKMVPKEGTFFRVEIPVEGEEDTAETREADPTETATTTLEKSKMVVEILGSQFMHRAADRANRKFKHHFYKEL